jgi:hypothetical protein
MLAPVSQMISRGEVEEEGGVERARRPEAEQAEGEEWELV